MNINGLDMRTGIVLAVVIIIISTRLLIMLLKPQKSKKQNSNSLEQDHFSRLAHVAMGEVECKDVTDVSCKVFYGKSFEKEFKKMSKSIRDMDIGYEWVVRKENVPQFYQEIDITEIEEENKEKQTKPKLEYAGTLFDMVEED
ncbi:MAG: hypothetical protein ACOCQR_02850 [bacterium]